MTNANETPDYLDALFGPAELRPTAEEMAARMEALRAADAARVAAVKADAEARRLEAVRMRCPRCAGAGFLSQFQHRKGGECFACGGSGVRALA